MLHIKFSYHIQLQILVAATNLFFPCNIIAKKRNTSEFIKLIKD